MIRRVRGLDHDARVSGLGVLGFVGFPKFLMGTTGECGRFPLKCCSYVACVAGSTIRTNT